MYGLQYIHLYSHPLVNMDIIRKNVKSTELNTNIVSAVLNTQTLKMIKQKKKIPIAIKIIKKKRY